MSLEALRHVVTMTDPADPHSVKTLRTIVELLSSGSRKLSCDEINDALVSLNREGHVFRVFGDEGYNSSPTVFVTPCDTGNGCFALTASKTRIRHTLNVYGNMDIERDIMSSSAASEDPTGMCVFFRPLEAVLGLTSFGPYAFSATPLPRRHPCMPPTLKDQYRAQRVALQLTGHLPPDDDAPKAADVEPVLRSMVTLAAQKAVEEGVSLEDPQSQVCTIYPFSPSQKLVGAMPYVNDPRGKTHENGAPQSPTLATKWHESGKVEVQVRNTVHVGQELLFSYGAPEQYWSATWPEEVVAQLPVHELVLGLEIYTEGVDCGAFPRMGDELFEQLISRVKRAAQSRHTVHCTRTLCCRLLHVLDRDSSEDFATGPNHLPCTNDIIVYAFRAEGNTVVTWIGCVLYTNSCRLWPTWPELRFGLGSGFGLGLGFGLGIRLGWE